MIKVDRALVSIQGMEPTVRAEFRVLCKHLRIIYADRYGIEKADEMLLEDLNISKKPLKNIPSEIDKLIAGRLLNDALKKSDALKEYMKDFIDMVKDNG